MRPVIRLPRISEWPACRMLIPGAFAAGARPEFRLAAQDSSPHIIGALSFRRHGIVLQSVMVHVLPQYRRRSVASTLLQHLFDEAKREGYREASAFLDLQADQTTERFLLAHGFSRGERLYSVEGDLVQMLRKMCALRDRLAASGRIPSGARITSLDLSNWNSVLELYSDHILRRPFLNPHDLSLSIVPEMAPLSRVLLVDGRVEGMILGDLDGSVARTHALVVTPGYRKSWAAVLLLAEAGEAARAAGARRTQFDFLETNIQRNLARRFQTKTIRILANFSHAIRPREV